MGLNEKKALIIEVLVQVGLYSFDNAVKFVSELSLEEINKIVSAYIKHRFTQAVKI